ncbi:permease [Draconibacterium sp. IB214405]|uniref:permease n=1 Tax=Draconibacterium sp. IB214405 TaxID=3097352 RepID=UPI002A0D47BF|nr:permease [Draconibacterium sp. IB214405]MDX8340639.1 permease [Draconibacterium sp. IB214405]
MNKTEKNQKEWILRGLIYFSITLLLADFIYKSYYGINYQTRENCILYTNLPRWAFLIYEFSFDLFMTVLVGIFIGTLLQKHFTKYKRFYPRNQFSAFLYAAVIPVCSCSAIPMMGAMQGQLRLRTIITFVVAAPLLNPYIVALSFTVLGNEYAFLRIVSSLLVALGAGYFAEFVAPKTAISDPEKLLNCSSNSTCTVPGKSIYSETFRIFKKLFPYLLIAGLISLAFEVFQPTELLEKFQLKEGPLSSAVFILIGMPIYFCNGADILFLQPLVNYGDLSMGSSIAFSLTSTAICVSSFMMLLKYLGKKLTIQLSLFIMAAIFMMSQLIEILNF